MLRTPGSPEPRSHDGGVADRAAVARWSHIVANPGDWQKPRGKKDFRDSVRFGCFVSLALASAVIVALAAVMVVSPQSPQTLLLKSAFSASSSLPIGPAIHPAADTAAYSGTDGIVDGIRTEQTGKPVTSSDTIVAIAEGDLPARLQSLCLAPAVAATLWRRQQQRTGEGWAQPAGTRLGLRAGAGEAEAEAKRVTVVWAQGESEAVNAGVAFRALFEGPPARNRMDLSRGLAEFWPDVEVAEGGSSGKAEAEGEEGLEEINMDVPHCSEDSTSDGATPGITSAHPGWRVSLKVPRQLKMLTHQDWSPAESCSALRLFQSCLGALQPSPRVSKLLDMELEGPEGGEEGQEGKSGSVLSRLKSSTAVYLEANQAMPAGTCNGCPEDPLLNCTLRTLTWQYLRVPSNSSDVDFTVAAASATDAAAVAATYHPLRAPLLLPHTLKRIAMNCPVTPSPSSPLSPSSPPSVSQPSEAPAESAESNEPQEFELRPSEQQASLDSSEGGSENEGHSEEESENKSGSGGEEQSESGEEGGNRRGKRGRVTKRRWVLEQEGEKSEGGREEEEAEMQGEVKEEDGASGAEEGSNSKAGGSNGSITSGKTTTTTSSSSSSSSSSSAAAPAADTRECQALQLAELLLLSRARGLIHTRPSVEALFIAAQARRHWANQNADATGTATTAAATAATTASPAADAGDDESANEGSAGAFVTTALPAAPGAASSFVVEPSVCEAPEQAPFKNMWFLRQYLVDEELKTIYCFVPKAACTSWKVWFRQQHHLPNITDVYLAHDPKNSGLHVLASGYTESRVMALLTRPDFFKFTFVRNPYARLASAYLNKHVNGGPPQGRAFWNKRFFHGTRPFRWIVEHQNGTDLLQFGDFVALLRTMFKRRRRTIDPHVAPQVDVCRLNDIHFDFVGHFENLAQDVPVVMQRLNRTMTDEAFSIGKSAHPTNARDKIFDLFDQRAFDEAMEFLSIDMNVPLNNISFATPPRLLELFGQVNKALSEGKHGHR